LVGPLGNGPGVKIPPNISLGLDGKGGGYNAPFKKFWGKGFFSEKGWFLQKGGGKILPPIVGKWGGF